MELLYPVSKPTITEVEVEFVANAVRSGWVSSLGEYIENFEAEFAAFCGARHALVTSNGTTGLHLVLEALGIGQGDEVIVPDLTFVATANAVSYSGATPVLVDVDPHTLCIDPTAIRQAITPRTRAIIPVHLYGHPADMDAINAIAAEFKLRVIEDAAEAHGAEYRGKRVGGLADCGIFSFYGNKIITTGEGGMITTNNETLYKRAKFLRDHAMSPDRRYWHPEIGFNYRMTNMQAALGLAQMRRIDEILAHRAALAEWYAQAIDTSDAVRINRVAPWAKSAYWMICLEVDCLDAGRRDGLMATLRGAGIDSRPYFSPLSSMPMYETRTGSVALRKSKTGLNLPTYHGLTRQDVQHIGAVVNESLSGLMRALG